MAYFEENKITLGGFFMKKKILAICLSIILVVGIFTIFSSCSNDNQFTDTDFNNPTISDNSESEMVTVKVSPDKYTWYIKNYVGKNCASLGYTSMSIDRFDRYGEGLLELIFVTAEGTYIDIESDDDLKGYYVTAQSIPVNSELKLTFQKDSEGVEYDSLIANQSYEEIVLFVQKVGSLEKNDTKLIEIKPSLDKYTRYVANYVGRNLADCGYTSMGGELRHAYGEGNIKFIIVSNDGTYIDPEDTETLKNYVVIGQSIAPNTEIRLTFDKDSNGIEYDSLVESQNIDEIELTVKPIVT